MAPPVPGMAATVAPRVPDTRGAVEIPARASGFQLPSDLAAAQAAFDRELAKRIDRMADRLEGTTSRSDDALEQSLARLEAIGRVHGGSGPPELAARLDGLLPLARRIERLTMSLDQEVGRGAQPAA